MLFFSPSLSHFSSFCSWCLWLDRRRCSLLASPTWPAYLWLSLLPSFFLSRSLTLELSKLLGTFLIEGNADLLLLVVVKVAGVAWSFRLGDEGSFHLQTDRKTNTPGEKQTSHTGSHTSHTQSIRAYLFLVEGDPVSGRKPLVSLDVVDPILKVPETFCEIHLWTMPIRFPHFNIITHSAKKKVRSSWKRRRYLFLPVAGSSGGPSGLNWSGTGNAPKADNNKKIW